MTFVGFWFQAIVDSELHAHLNLNLTVFRWIFLSRTIRLTNLAKR